MKILLVGTGGYADIYVQTLLKDDGIEWVGAVDPYIDNAPSKEKIEAKNIPVFDDIEDFYGNNSADLVIIATPTYLHCEQSIEALRHGSNVLVEKPVAPTVEEAEQMAEAERKYGRFIAVGYQWSFSDTMLELKKDILNGRFGSPISLKTIVSWPRNKAYYGRGTGWGGKIKKDGRLVLDSIASNACAHYLHNLLFVTGPSLTESATSSDIRAELYRANDIENFDTCTIKFNIRDGAECFYAATHASGKVRNPEFVYEFQNGTVYYAQDKSNEVTAVFKDGSTKNYGDPFRNQVKKLYDCIEAVKTGSTPICTCKTAEEHTKMINCLYENCRIYDFPKEKVYTENNTVIVKDLFNDICRAYDEMALLSEINDGN